MPTVDSTRRTRPAPFTRPRDADNAGQAPRRQPQARAANVVGGARVSRPARAVDRAPAHRARSRTAAATSPAPAAPRRRSSPGGAASSVAVEPALTTPLRHRLADGVWRALDSGLQIAREGAAVALVGAYVGAGLVAATGLYGLMPHLMAGGAAVGMVVGLLAAWLGRHPHVLRGLRAGLRRLDDNFVRNLARRAGRDTIERLRRRLEAGLPLSGLGVGVQGGLLAGALLFLPQVMDWLAGEDRD